MSDHGQHLRIVPERDPEEAIRMIAGTLSLSALDELGDVIWPFTDRERFDEVRDKLQDGFAAVMMGVLLDMERTPRELAIKGRAQDALDRFGPRLRRALGFEALGGVA